MIANIHKCEQCDDARFHGREWCDLHTKKLCIECRNSFSVSQMTADRETGWLFCSGCWAKKPAPSQQESSAMTASAPNEMTNCWECDHLGVKSEMVKSDGGWLTHQTCARPEVKASDDGNLPGQGECDDECSDGTLQGYWGVTLDRGPCGYRYEGGKGDECAGAGLYEKSDRGYRCPIHGRYPANLLKRLFEPADHTPRTSVDHPNPAPPEAQTCDDGNQQITPVQMHWCADKRCRQPGNVKTYPEPEICAGGRCRSHCGTEGGCAACITPERRPCIVCGVPLNGKTPGAQKWNFRSPDDKQYKSGLTHENCVEVMIRILSKEATK